MKRERHKQETIITEEYEQTPVSLVVDDDIISPNRDTVSATYTHFFTSSQAVNNYQFAVVEISSGVQILNGSVEEFYQEAYYRLHKKRPEIIYELPVDYIKLLRQPNFYHPVGKSRDTMIKQWRMNNCYCYQLCVTQLYKPAVAKLFWTDINTFFGFKYCIEGRVINVPKAHFVLRRQPKGPQSLIDIHKELAIDLGTITLKRNIEQLVVGLPVDRQLPVEIMAEANDSLIRATKAYHTFDQLVAGLRTEGYLLRQELLNVPQIYLSRLSNTDLPSFSVKI